MGGTPVKQLHTLMLILLSGCGDSDIQHSDERVNTAWLDVFHQYQRRVEMTPNLVISVQAHATHEKEVPDAGIGEYGRTQFDQRV